MDDLQKSHLANAATAGGAAQNRDTDDSRKKLSVSKLSYEATRAAMDLFDRPEGPAYFR